MLPQMLGDEAGRRPAPNIRAPADVLGPTKPLPQETVRPPRSGDPRFVRKPANPLARFFTTFSHKILLFLGRVIKYCSLFT